MSINKLKWRNFSSIVGHLFSIVVWNKKGNTMLKSRDLVLEVLSLRDNYSRMKVECNRMEYTQV
jgi:hypothetical protein